jgi:hypothetical protein
MPFLEALTQHRDLYQVILGPDGPVIFRLLPYQTYLSFKNLLVQHPRTKALVEDEIWRNCVVVHPYEDESLDYGLAGTVTSVAQLILFLSAPQEFEDLEDSLNQGRYQVQVELHLQMQVYICRAFPAYTPEMLDALTFPQLAVRLAQAEYLTGQKLELEKPKKQKSRPGAAIDFRADNQELRALGPGEERFDSFNVKR